MMSQWKTQGRIIDFCFFFLCLQNRHETPSGTPSSLAHTGFRSFGVSELLCFLRSRMMSRWVSAGVFERWEFQHGAVCILVHVIQPWMGVVTFPDKFGVLVCPIFLP